MLLTWQFENRSACIPTSANPVICLFQCETSRTWIYIFFQIYQNALKAWKNSLFTEWRNHNSLMNLTSVCHLNISKMLLSIDGVGYNIIESWQFVNVSYWTQFWNISSASLIRVKHIRILSKLTNSRILTERFNSWYFSIYFYLSLVSRQYVSFMDEQTVLLDFLLIG